MSPSHYIDWDQPGRGKVPAICGTYLSRLEHSNTPTCPECADALAARDDGKTAEETFGPPPVGTQVTSPAFNATPGYTERRPK